MQTTQIEARRNPTTVGPLDLILSRLERVQVAGRGYRARCPAHGGKSQSLAITAGDDGRALLHCFAGCTPAQVCESVGLSITDLFPPRLSDLSPEGQQQLRQHARRAMWAAALGLLVKEAGVILVAAGDVLAGRMSAENLDRVSLAESRISEAQAVLR